MATLLTALVFLLPCAVTSGALRVGSEAGATLRTQTVWADEVCAELDRSSSERPVLYASRVAASKARSDASAADLRTREAARKASAKAAASPAKAPAAEPDRSVLPTVPNRNPSLEEVLERARSVWGNEDRMMEMLSGIVYTEKEARRDGIEPRPHMSSLTAIRDLPAPVAAQARATTPAAERGK